MKANKTISEIARLLVRHRSIISREFDRGRGQRGSRAEQAYFKMSEQAQRRRNASRVDTTIWSDVAFFLGLHCIPEQIEATVEISHESVDLHVYANKAAGDDLHTHLRSQKPRRKRHLCWRDRPGQIQNLRPISKRPSRIKDHKPVGYWEGDTVIGSVHKQAIVTLVKRKIRFAVLVKVPNMSAYMVSGAIESKLKPLSSRVKTLSVDNGK